MRIGGRLTKWVSFGEVILHNIFWCKEIPGEKLCNLVICKLSLKSG